MLPMTDQPLSSEVVNPTSFSTRLGDLRSRLARAPSFTRLKRSWIDPRAQKHDLLYVSDEGTNVVYVYTWPQAKRVGELTGLNYPEGECVDDAGDVWITELGASKIVEYRHGAVKPSETLYDAGYYPMGCAVSGKSSDVAVTNLETLAGGQGDFVIFRKGESDAVAYTYPYTDYYYCAYDSQGDLFADGEYEGQGGFELTELPAGSKKVVGITPNHSMDYPPGNVEWHKTLLTIGDPSRSVIDRFSINGANATEIGETILGKGSDPLGYQIEDKVVVASNVGNASVMFWRFPAGGQPFRKLTDVTAPVGAVISRYAQSPPNEFRL